MKALESLVNKTRKGLKNLAYAGVVGLSLAGEARELKADSLFENIPVTTAPGYQIRPAVWGNYIVWQEGQNEAYDISQRKIVDLPGLVIDNAPAIWDDKVVWQGAEGYYDLKSQQMVHSPGLLIGNEPAIHDNRIVWAGEDGYYDLKGQRVSFCHNL